MSDCTHERFNATVQVHRLLDGEGGAVVAYSAEVQVQCAQCLAPFEFVGVGMGSSPIEPLTDVGRTTLRAPIVPPGAEVNPNTFGYRIQQRGPVGPIS